MELFIVAKKSYNQKYYWQLIILWIGEKSKRVFNLNTLSIVVLCPHVLEDGIHGSPVIKLLFKLMRVT